MSPRETSTSSSSRSVTDSGGNASSSSPSKVSMPAMRVVRPDGSTTTSSPARNTPEATSPA